MIHRNLKPGNVMMDRAGQPHLTNFGLAKREAGEITMTMDGQILGTPAYMSPEQARGDAHKADRRSNVYSLGVILSAPNGRATFPRQPADDGRADIAGRTAQSAEVATRVPRDLETICLKCMEKAPGNRYQTAGEATAEFGRICAASQSSPGRSKARAAVAVVQAEAGIGRADSGRGLDTGGRRVGVVVLRSKFYRQARLAQENENPGPEREKARRRKHAPSQNAEASTRHELARRCWRKPA